MHNLFIVDDDVVFQRILKLLLVKYPVFKNVHYYNEAMPMMKYLATYKSDYANLPDVIFLDLFMPGMDGWGFLDILEQLYSSLCKKPKVYIVTVSVQQDDKIKASTYPFVTEFISKPIYKDKLIAICEDVNNKHQLRA